MLVITPVQLINCPHCGKFCLEARVMNFSSGLGPETVGCPRCQKTFQTSRQPWNKMSGGSRRAFVIVTMIYAVALFLLTGSLVDQSVQMWNGVGEPETLRFREPTFLICGAAGALAAIAIQAARVAVSRNLGDHEELTWSKWLWSPNWNLQIKVLLVLVLVPALVLLLTRLR